MKLKLDKSAPNEPPNKAEAHEELKQKMSGKKVGRHHLTLSESEYSMIETLRKRLTTAGVAVRKHDLLRAGIKELSELSLAKLNKKLSKLYLHI
jgi:hypothetical protein